MLICCIKKFKTVRSIEKKRVEIQLAYKINSDKEKLSNNFLKQIFHVHQITNNSV